MIIIFRHFIVRNPEKQHFVEREILYQMRFFRVSGDKITKSYDYLKIILKIFHFSRYRLSPLPVWQLLIYII